MRYLIPLTLLVLLAPAYAQMPVQDLKGVRVTLDAQASAEVDNDVMHAALYIEMDDSDATRLADKVNRATDAAVKTAKEFSSLRVKTAGYTTYSMSDPNSSKIARWRARSDISMDSEDFRSMAEAIGKLQASMKLGNVNFSVSPALRAKTEDELIRRAIAEFLRKAEIVQKGFGGASFSVLEANVSSGNRFQTVQTLGIRGTSMSASEAAPAAPSVEAGTSRVTVTVNGAILIPR